MASPGRPPPKPWERTCSSGDSPFTPPSATTSTAAVVESAGVANPGVRKENTNTHPVNGTNVGRPMPPRPWERNQGSGYNPMTNYNPYSVYGSGSYGYSPYGNNYRSGFYTGMYGGGYGMSGNTFGGYYGGGFGHSYGPMGGYGMGMGGPFGNGQGGPFGNGQGDPNDPFGGGPPPGPPTFWQSVLRIMHGVMNFFGRLAMLIDQNTQAFHFFITALLQLFDRGGLLYGELARFVLRILGFRCKSKLQPNAERRASSGQCKEGQHYLEGPKEGGGAWDNLWSDKHYKTI